MFPLPDTGMPIDALLLVQLNVSPPPVLAVKGMLIASPGQNAWFAVAEVITGSGFTVTVNVRAGPVQLFKLAVTLMVAVTGKAVALVAVNAGISVTTPDPSAIPIAAPPLQLNVSPPPVFALNGIAAPASPAQ